MKKFISAVIIMLQISFFLLPVQSLALDETTTVIVHYQETEDNEKDWNLWVWPIGGEGDVYHFTEDDVFGKVVTVVLPGNHDSVGFIVRTDSWEKDTSNDRFVEEFNNGVAEIWVKGGIEEFTYENPNGPASIGTESVNLNISYNRYSDDYEGISADIYLDSLLVDTIDFNESEFGLNKEILISNTLDKKLVEVSIVRNNQEIARYKVKKILSDETEVYLVENQERVYYSEADVISKPKFVEAKLDNTKTINIKTNMPFKAENVKVMVNGESVSIESLEFDSFDDSYLMPEGAIHLSDKVKYTDEITLSIKNFDNMNVRLGDVYDTEEFAEMYTYTGDDLGNTYFADETIFKVWAPTASEVNVITYDNWDNDEGVTHVMQPSQKGTWTATIKGDLHNQLYAYEVTLDAEPVIVVDPYAKAVTANGIKSAVVDLERTDPDTWDNEYKTDFTGITDAIMYEIHVRDLSMHGDSGIVNKGKFLGFTEEGTKTSNGYSTGLDYIADLGVTHIQLMPVYDYGSINETKNDYSFNWGYDPVNYNAIEGSYSSDPYTPDVRIVEFKEMIQSIHDKGLKVTMDVVYNHVFSLQAMSLEKIVPGYYFRKEANGNYANGSGCGNETASERPMMRKFIVDSVTYLADEYNLDGFRFDLMGLHDVETMNEIRDSLNEIDPSITIIGEGWNMGNVLDADLRANQNQAYLMEGIAHFNDTIRDGLKGSVFDSLDRGFVNGKEGMAAVVLSGIVGGIDFSDSINTWGDIEPTQSVTYVEAHDNNTLYDKLKLSNPDDENDVIKKMHLLSDSIVLTSQGVSFIHAGQEFMRTKFGDENSYKSSDVINRLDWLRREKNDDVVNYFKGLIKLRKTHPAFRMSTSHMIKENLEVIKSDDNVIYYQLKNNANNDSWENIVVIHNANRNDLELELPFEGEWTVVVDGIDAGTDSLMTFTGDKIEVDDLNTVVLYGEELPEEGKHIILYILLAITALSIVYLISRKRNR